MTCLSAYLNGAPTWSAWEHPWVTSAQYGFTSWVAQEPQIRQVVLQVDLIPTNLENVDNPSKWEMSCARGDFDSHATEFGQNLVAAGLENSVLRLGPEMNGIWEDDFVGTTIREQRLWATCFANEVTGLRHAVGEHFLIDWNPNACKESIPYARYYPGNSYVDIIGLDLFDVGCETPRTPLSFTQLSDEPAGLAHFEAFGASKGKPMSFPEWALSSIPSGDDPAFISGMGSTFDSKNFAFETYFDGGGRNIKALPLGPQTPRSLVAFQEWFGGGSPQ